jgi:hypothetical protein
MSHLSLMSSHLGMVSREVLATDLVGPYMADGSVFVGIAWAKPNKYMSAKQPRRVFWCFHIGPGSY